MSAAVLMLAMKRFSGGGHLWTVEGSEQQYSLAKEMLKDSFGESVCCRYGNTREELPLAAAEARDVELFFHDAGHSRDDYVRDFDSVMEYCVPGATLIFDDIRWNDPRFVRDDPLCYEGWREVIEHPRVSWAVEIDDSIGLLLLA